MTPEFLEQRYLSIRYWMRTSLLPAALLLLLVLIFIRVWSHTNYDRNHAAVIAGFFTVFFILVRAGHLYMIRAMHMDLKATYATKYAQKLRKLPKNMRRQNIGFALARIKSELIHQKD